MITTSNQLTHKGLKMNNELILNNLRLLYSAVEAHPEEIFDLSSYKQESSCGTLFCTAGLAASMSVFQAQGVGWKRQFCNDADNYGDDWHYVTVDGIPIYETTAADYLFGTNSFENCFAANSMGARDWDGFGYEEVPDKQLALWRLEQQIESVTKELQC